MVSRFRAEADSFSEELQAISDLVSMFDTPDGVNPTIRNAASNSAMLLLAATFEVFIRAMAKLTAKHIVSASTDIARLPDALLKNAWRQTFETITRARLPQRTRTNDFLNTVRDAKGKADSVFSFFQGTLTEDIYDELVRTERQMRVDEINRLFSFCRLSNVCSRVAQQQPVADHFNSSDTNLNTSDLEQFINAFIERRNNIAHQLTASSALAPSIVRDYIAVFRLFADSLCGILEQHTTPFVAAVSPAPASP